MTRTADQLTASDLALFRETAQRRSVARAMRLAQRRLHAMALAQQAAKMLKDKFGVTKVIVFGSLSQAGRFNELSDIDLAVEDIQPGDYFRAIAELLTLDNQFKFDLVDMNDCPPELGRVIAQEGKPL